MAVKKIGVLTSGGDAPGMNAAVRSVVRCGLSAGFEMYGIYDGFRGLLNEEIEQFSTRNVCDILSRGGTVLSTARCNEFKELEYQKKGAEIARKHGLDAIVVIGGDGSFMGARALSNQGILTIGIPGTIDNDIACSEYTIGYDTALNTAMEAIDKIRDTMTSHNRCCLVEVMGRNAGYLALHIAVARGAETALIPEKDFDFQRDVIDPVKTAKAGMLDFSDFDFSLISFNTRDVATIIPLNTKVKKYSTLQFMVRNNELSQGLGVLGIEKRYKMGSYKKY